MVWWNQHKMQTSSGIATTVLLTSYFLQQAIHSSGIDQLDVIRRERLLRQFVQFTYAHKQLCLPYSWTSDDRMTKINPNDARSFQPVFSQIFAPQNLTKFYLPDVQQAILVARIAGQLRQHSPDFVLTELFRSFVQTAHTGELHGLQLGDLQNQFTYILNRRSTLLTIAACRGEDMVSHAGFDRLNVPYCSSKLNRTFSSTNNISGYTSGDIHGQWLVQWLTGECDSVPPSRSSSIAVQLLVTSNVTEKTFRLLFEFDLRNFTLDQCALGAHRCSFTTQCQYHQYSEWSFAMDNYVCRCTNTFYLDNADNGYPAPFIHAQLNQTTRESVRHFQCLPCPPGCSQCGGNHTCRVSTQPTLLRSVPLAIQSFCCTICVFLGISVFRLRRTRVIRAANWVLMEILLVGAILLYLIVVLMYFPASDVTCLIIPWLRELGFSVMYGVLIVKIYRVLSCFQSRKAHRVHVRDKDILKFLGIFIITTVAYMVAWTAVNLDYISSAPWSRYLQTDTQVSVVQTGEISLSETQPFGWSNQSSLVGESVAPSSAGTRAITFHVCRSMSWDVVVELAEFIILAISIHYCRLVRTAPSEFNETLYISAALILELSISVLFNIVRHVIWYRVHPDYMFLMYFARSHFTITVNLVLIFGPKAWFLYRPASFSGGGNRTRATPSAPYTVDPNLAPPGKLNLALNGDLDIVDVNLADMDPEVIRRELKRLYTQIELYKTKAMRKDNPHISKRRGGRKQRRFSLQPFHKRHHGQSVLGAVPLMSSSEAGYCWAECRSGRGSSGQCHKHGSRTNVPQSPSSGSNPSGRPSSFYVQSGIVHDEEVSKLSEESTNSTEDFTPPSNVQEHSIVCATESTSSGIKTPMESKPTPVTGVRSAIEGVSRKPPNSPNINID